MADIDFHPSQTEKQNVGKNTENALSNAQNEALSARVVPNNNRAEIANQTEAMTKGDKPLLPAFDMSRFGDDSKQSAENSSATNSSQTDSAENTRRSNSSESEKANTGSNTDSSSNTNSDTAVSPTASDIGARNNNSDKVQGTTDSKNSDVSNDNKTADGQGSRQGGSSAAAPAPAGSEKVQLAVPQPASAATTAGSQSVSP